MPRGNRMGPAGLGPMTGRGMGYCAGFSVPGFLNRAGGFAYGGFGRGRGFRNMYYMTGLPAWARYGVYDNDPYAASADERTLLTNQQKALEEELKLIRTQLKKLEEQNEEND